MRSEERSYKYYLAITLQYYFAPDSPQSVTQALSSTMASHSTGTPRGSPLLPTATRPPRASTAHHPSGKSAPINITVMEGLARRPHRRRSKRCA